MTTAIPKHPRHSHRYRSPWRRGFYAVLLITAVVGGGTVGMHRIEGMSYLDAFYFMSMVATAQGPAQVPATAAGKLFAALMAFVSIGTVVASLGFLFGPFFGKLWRIGVEHLEEEWHVLAGHGQDQADKKS